VSRRPSARVPTPARRVFLSPDYQAGPNPNPQPLAPNPYCLMPVIHEESIKVRAEPPDSNRPSVDFGALGRYISVDYKEKYGHSY